MDAIFSEDGVTIFLNWEFANSYESFSDSSKGGFYTTDFCCIRDGRGGCLINGALGLGI